jgi:hypothetical protein
MKFKEETILSHLSNCLRYHAKVMTNMHEQLILKNLQLFIYINTIMHWKSLAHTWHEVSFNAEKAMVLQCDPQNTSGTMRFSRSSMLTSFPIFQWTKTKQAYCGMRVILFSVINMQSYPIWQYFLEGQKQQNSSRMNIWSRTAQSLRKFALI